MPTWAKCNVQGVVPTMGSTPSYINLDNVTEMSGGTHGTSIRFVGSKPDDFIMVDEKPDQIISDIFLP
jgi:hypothetical protein